MTVSGPAGVPLVPGDVGATGGSDVTVALGAAFQALAAGEQFPMRPAGPRPPRTAPEGSVPVRRRALVRRPLEQAHLCAVWPGLASDDPDRYALGVCNQILGGGLSSRLFQEIREELEEEPRRLTERDLHDLALADLKIRQAQAVIRKRYEKT